MFKGTCFHLFLNVLCYHISWTVASLYHIFHRLIFPCKAESKLIFLRVPHWIGDGYRYVYKWGQSSPYKPVLLGPAQNSKRYHIIHIPQYL
jgi:hypothetical protein